MRPYSLLRLAVCAALPFAAACSERSPVGQSEDEAPALRLAGRVTDAAGVPSPAEEAALSAKSSAWERSTAHQLVFVTAPDLAGDPVDVYTRRLGNGWGIGRRSYDDGLILLVAPNDRKARVEVGRGLELKLPDTVAEKIMEEEMVPRFRGGDYAAGLDAGADALIARVRATEAGR